MINDELLQRSLVKIPEVQFDFYNLKTTDPTPPVSKSDTDQDLFMATCIYIAPNKTDIINKLSLVKHLFFQ